MANFYKKRNFVILCLLGYLFGGLLLTAPVEVKATDTNAEKSFLGGLKDTGEGVGYVEKDQPDETNTKDKIAGIIGRWIAAVISFIGLIFIALIFMGALDIIGAGGNDEKVLDGKNKIKNGAIGILIVFAAYIFAALLLTLATGNFSDNPIFKL